jgi:hypothetical protein
MKAEGDGEKFFKIQKKKLLHLRQPSGAFR